MYSDDEMAMRGAFNPTPPPKSPTHVYELIWEDLTHLGGPMGSEYTTESSLGLFADKAAAKEEAQKAYAESGLKHGFMRKETLKWVRDKRRHEIRTPDMGFVMLHIVERKVK